MKKLISIIFFILLISCNNSENITTKDISSGKVRMERQQKRHRGNHPRSESENIRASGDTVYIPAGSPVCARLTHHKVDEQEHLVQFITTGVVKPMSGHKAEMAAPFEGRIVKTFVKLGQKVTAGTPLFELSSSDYLESVRIFLQARREKELAEKNLKRKKDLLDSGIGSGREYDEAKLEFDLAEKEYEKTTAILKIFNLDPEDADLTRPLVIRSPIAGEVIRTDITVGQYIKSDSDPVIIIADLNKIWVIASVREKDLGSVTFQDQAEIFTESMPDKALKGYVDYIGNIMNEQTRSVEVYIECNNPGQLLKCGMFVTIRFYHKINNAIIVPSSSVLQDFDKCFLFVQADQETYVKKEVTVTSLPDKSMIVNSGVRPGDIIVSEGAIYLR